MSYGFPRRFDYAYPTCGPVRVGLSGPGMPPSLLATAAANPGPPGEGTDTSMPFSEALPYWLVIGGVGILGLLTLGFPFYFAYKVVSSAEEES